MYSYNVLVTRKYQITSSQSKFKILHNKHILHKNNLLGLQMLIAWKYYSDIFASHTHKTEGLYYFTCILFHQHLLYVQ